MIERWVRFWDQREAPHSLMLLRLLVGVVLLADLLQAATFGAISLLWAPAPVGAGYGQSLSPAPLAVRLLGAGAETGAVLWALAVVSCVGFIAGFCYRVTSIVLVFAMVELYACQPVGDGVDALLRIVLPVLAVSGAGASFSFDAWSRRRRGKPVPSTVPAWPRYLVFIQLTWVYTSAGLQRDAKSWGPFGGFAAIGNVLGDPHFARFSPGSLALLSPLTRLATVVTMAFELSAPLILLWTWLAYRPERGGRVGELARRLRIRWVWLCAGVSLHAGIALTMKIGIFPFAMLALYPAFLHPSELVRGLDDALRVTRARVSGWPAARWALWNAAPKRRTQQARRAGS